MWRTIYHLANLAIKITSPHGSMGIPFLRAYSENLSYQINWKQKKISANFVLFGSFFGNIDAKGHGSWPMANELLEKIRYRPSQNWWHVCSVCIYVCVYVCNISHISCFTVLNNCIQLCEHSEATELRKIMKKNKVLKHLQLFGEHKRFE